MEQKIYLILAEARSGGSHLMDYLGTSYPKYTLAQEPFTGAPNKFTDDKDVTNLSWLDNYGDIFIREIYNPEANYGPLMERAHKVICLYRNNWFAQIRSILYTGRINLEWAWTYRESEMYQMCGPQEIQRVYYNSYKSYKQKFQNFIQQKNLVSVCHEDLYYGGDAIKKVMGHFGLHSEFDFPLYERHMKTDDGSSPVGKELPPEEITDLRILKNFVDKDNMLDYLIESIEDQKRINKILKNEIEKITGNKLSMHRFL